ncbi:MULTISPECIES: LPS O-antigen chain length determinant protein WzzB [Leclercia]|jgi:chain length determinant protein (polysaccharide antigen chain regulator)|uniref:Chain length determinant protein n=1 Tax=Leclercia adecarboxylata TaxID=83655 RepID=A0A4U9I2L2_9ENTR|nr:LPS O-antigen chain length determinant protein WzzB [Leclercia adecarboxylata]ALZ95922.1 chain length determination protein [Leclercia adecarboxylata]KFC98158.1 O-antigen lipopolysaccharide chain length regulator [Leclercia adecarboxylata ATCC 23216 = NBRC 102595]MBM6636674.1 LPS O-antigen chain length determinant protein WzzB [Leclercia adecarboxylata]MBZ3798960.1 LPS O-antigen chain length determinant protein WzzB [Leclercia adecarboxylata]MBZ3803880.1 LPS O-antigen chain length determina
MTHNNNNTVMRSNDPEQIDLIDLLVQLWRGKWLIAVFIAIALIIAGLYLAFAKEKWTSTAIITQPDAAQIGSYSNALNILYGSNAPKLTEIQASVITRYNASFSALSQTLENGAVPESLTIEPTVKGQDIPLSIKYVSSSAEAAQKQVAQYIQQIDEQIQKELEVDLNDNIKQQVTSLNDVLGNQETIAQEQKDVRIKQITEALKYAEAANITTPKIQQTQDVTQETMFLLGTEALQSMIAHESSRPLTLSDSYYQNKQKLLDIQKLKIDPTTIHAYRYVMKPDLPIRRDSPKRSLVLVLAVLLGGIVGSGIVLGRNALRNYQSRA